MEGHKLERIRSIRDEVRELHPLLEALFNRLPNIISVEYTHGPNEMGADFVLTKMDETLGNHVYIGCVVKVGQIKQDHSDVIRQIEECELERTIESGKKKIFLTEIWVLSTGNITRGAEAKLHHRFKNTSIQFVSGEKLANLIDKHFSDYWRDIDVSTGEYLRSVAACAESLSGGSLISAAQRQDIYIPQKLVKIVSKKKYGHLARSQIKNIEDVVEKESFILIEAQMGTGKSTLVARLALAATEAEVFNSTRRLPILITARDLASNYDGDVGELVSSTINKNTIATPLSYLVIVDALDEVKLSVDKRVEQLRKIFETARCLDQITLIVTTRSLDNPEIETAIDDLYARYSLCALTVGQVVSLVGKYCKDTGAAKRLTKDLDRSHLFKVLPKTPISAILLAKLLNEHIQEIPSTMTELYEKYMELVVGRWDMEKGLQSQREYDVILNVLINLAQFTIDNSLVDVPVGDVRHILEEYVSERNLNIDMGDLLEIIIKKEEVVQFNELKGVIQFNHRTFAEFFYAKALHRDDKASINENIYDPYWATSYFFYIGLKRDCPDLIKKIDSINFSDHRGEVLKIFGHGNFLLAAYLTPYRAVTDSVLDSFRMAGELYCKIIRGEVESPLNMLSNIHILFIFTKALCNAYGYDYFLSAIQIQAQELATSPSLDEAGFVELFLLNSVLLTLRKSDAYDTMVASYGKYIPTEVQIGIEQHSRDEGRESVLVKKYIKSFQKKLKANLPLREFVVALYETPSVELLEKRIGRN